LWAAAKKDLSMVKFLVENGAHLLKPKKDGMTILHISASSNDIHTLEYALQMKDTASVDIQNEEVS
jgi:ankyrin repeat protein